MQPKTNEIILGIDPGYGRCGFAVIAKAGSQLNCLTHGVITTHAGLSHARRLLEISQDLQEIIKTFNPYKIAVEELFFAKATTTVLKVAEARGVIIATAAKSGLEVLEIKPNEVKIALTGYGNADKGQVQRMIKTVFNLSKIPRPDDAADALAIAWTAAAITRYD
ncbi:crossover junction endodeoxyribonuclease RuvC [Candidatus Parcubacteria bacterium]|nr:MAG: crossover junction endodeoxyribonuclease RuvC [Candidatus Parcubacteria bacterium]